MGRAQQTIPYMKPIQILMDEDLLREFDATEEVKRDGRSGSDVTPSGLVTICAECTEVVRNSRTSLPPPTLEGYTIGMKRMKTAVSLPGDLFREAERHAKRTSKSRSQLYAEALAEYLARHAPDEVTEAMNRVVDKLELEERGSEPFVRQAVRRLLESTDW
jgi:metal-responsive CopG/Arc/MetJ family transcriptional regulator